MRVLALLMSLAVAGCAVAPSQPVGNGSIMRVVESANGQLLMQIAAESPERCRSFVERVRATKGYSSGEVAVVCTNVDGVNEIPFRSAFLDEWDGSSFTLNAKTDLMCQYMAKTFLANRLPSVDRPRFKQTTPCKG